MQGRRHEPVKAVVTLCVGAQPVSEVGSRQSADRDQSGTVVFDRLFATAAAWTTYAKAAPSSLGSEFSHKATLRDETKDGLEV